MTATLQERGKHRAVEAPVGSIAGLVPFRADIQGLRAIAIALVVVYHLHTAAVPGGFVGVDVFFVISGYLITGNLLRTLVARRIVSIRTFYARRARRLLPAVAVVLTATWLAARAVLPSAQLPETASQIRAAALYFENWLLAHNAVDYLKSSSAATPVQHFWSLSIEEQFYVLWPLAFVVAALVLRRRGRRNARGVLLTVAIAATCLSFGWSIHETAASPTAAYFVSTTRIWELGAGAIAALLPAAIGTRLAGRWPLSWLGLALIGWSAFRYDDGTPFPGWHAAVPVLGAVLIVLSGGSARATAAVLALPPLRWLGDLSYSLYLWHWPLIVLCIAYTGHPIGLRTGVAVLVASLILAQLTYTLVENPVRRSRLLRRHRSLSLATVVALVVPVTLVAVFLADRPAPFDGHLDGAHIGAAALAPGAPSIRSAAPVPAPSVAGEDYAIASNTDCQVGLENTTPLVCTFGDTSDPVATVAVVGDSAAGQWSTALDEIAKAHHWRLVFELHSGCPWTAATVVRNGWTTPYTQCHTWGVQVLDDMKNLRPDVLITSDRSTQGTTDHPSADAASRSEIGAGMATYWKQLTALGTEIVAIRETPEMGRDIPSCLSSRTGSISGCSRSTAKAIAASSPIVDAVRDMMGDATLIDMNDLICAPTVCSPVVGNVVVYRDVHHLTKTYTRTLEPYLQSRLVPHV